MLKMVISDARYSFSGHGAAARFKKASRLCLTTKR
jgi:hypothetical protein